MQALIGIPVLVALAWAMSENRRAVGWRTVVGGVALQFALAVLLLRVPLVSDAFEAFARLVTGVIERSQAGIAFVFGSEIARGPDSPLGVVFAFNILPIVIFFASLMAVLHHVKVMQVVIGALAWLLRRTLGVTGAEALCMAANVFVGQTEAPLTVKPLVERMTRAQLMTLMVGGFATIAGSVLGVYIGFLGGGDEARTTLFAKHLITANVISAPAAFVMARLLVPETDAPPDESARALAARMNDERATNAIEAAAVGATDGLKLALNIGAMLLAFLSLLALINWPLEAWTGEPLEHWLGLALAPLAWLLGVEWRDAGAIGSLLGQKFILTEFVAFASLRDAIDAGAVSDRSAQVAAYALCGFANFGSIAIQIGGLSSIAPKRRGEVASLAMRAMIGGGLASFMTACVAGLLL